jgi:hypothetical protein
MNQKEKARIVEEEIMDSASKQCACSQRSRWEAGFNHKCIPVLQHPLYSPDLAPCDFYLFPKVKSTLKGTNFQSVDEVKSKTADIEQGVS